MNHSLNEKYHLSQFLKSFTGKDTHHEFADSAQPQLIPVLAGRSKAGLDLSKSVKTPHIFPAY